MERKTVGNPKSWAMRKRSSGAPYGLITTPSANGLIATAAKALGNRWATTAEAARPTKCLRFIQITIASVGPSCKIHWVPCKSMDPRWGRAHDQSNLLERMYHKYQQDQVSG